MVKSGHVPVYREEEGLVYLSGSMLGGSQRFIDQGGVHPSDIRGQETDMPDSTTHMPPANNNAFQQNLPYSVASNEDRCAPRQRIRVAARMRFSCSSSFPTEVTDMSIAGFACDALLQTHPGTLCWLTLPGLGALEAEVVWHGKNGMGCAFKNLLNLAVLNHYVAKFPAA
jgi:hypothetical protein